MDAQPADRSLDHWLEERIVGRICIAEYRVDGCDRCELLEHAVANVARMQDELDARECGKDVRPNEAVRIRDEADEMRPLRHQRRRGGGSSPPQRRISLCSMPK